MKKIIFISSVNHIHKITTSFMKFVAVSLVITGVFSCQREEDREEDEKLPGTQAALITSGIATRASGNTWDPGDTIGIWMVEDGDITIVDNTKNIPYHSNRGDGNFFAVNDAQTIYFPVDGSTVNFIAYYPWTTTATDGTYGIDVSDQTNPENIDLLYVHDIQPYSKEKPAVDLTFKHTLSQIRLSTLAGEGMPESALTGMTVTLEGMNTNANFNILTGQITNTRTKNDIYMRMVLDGEEYDAIILPATITTEGEIAVVFTADKNKYKWEVPVMEFESGKSYRWNITLKRSGVSVGNVKIEDWTVEHKGDKEAKQIYDDYVPLITDAKFRQYCLDNFDTDDNGKLSYEEIMQVTVIDIINRSISNLEAIKYFENLVTLDCSYNSLETLDLTGCTNLVTLNCSYNSLPALDLTGFTNLVTLNCYENLLETLDLTGFTNLEYLNCYTNSLETLYLTGCTNLEYLNCSYNSLETLDLTGCTNLVTLNCYNNSLEQLDVSHYVNLKSLSCDNNSLEQLDVSRCVNLQSLNCSRNPIQELDISGFSKITVRCGNYLQNELTVYVFPAATFGSDVMIYSTNSSGNYLPIYEKDTSSYGVTVKDKN